MEIKNVKGGYDYLPKEEKLRNYIKSTLIEVFKKHGYEAIETPILCFEDTLVDKYDENNDLVKEIYRLEDQGSRKLGLRYDLTVPFAKFVALNKKELNFPFKRYEIAKVFRDGPVKVGRDREFTQCDVDVVGLNGQMIEAELLQMYASVFKKLEIDIIIKYNSRNLIIGLIKEVGVKEDSLDGVITIIDKFDKLPKNEIFDLLKCFNIEEKQIEKLFSFFDLSVEELVGLFINTENEYITKGLLELNNLYGFIKGSNLEEVCKFSPTLVRGQNYYTGNVFEVYEKSYKIRGSIGGGGRYDNMITEFIGDEQLYPCVGISFGLTSIYELLKNRNMLDNDVDLLVIPMDTQKESLILANNLRDNGLNVLVEMENKKIGKSMKFADRNKIKYVIIYGEEEIKNNSFTIKNMFNSQSLEISENELNLVDLMYLTNKFGG